ncbi:MAG: glutaredoxin family protein [Candidatus Marinimicrobia bacterium]|nr:glutaredoxin family protein [Candidatus Neomarinimicrobiota bacterium]
MTKHYPHLRFYTKESCHLCDIAFEIVVRISKKIKFTLETVDITQSDDLMMKYGIEIPVIEINGNLEFKHKVNAKHLLRRLKNYSEAQIS